MVFTKFNKLAFSQNSSVALKMVFEQQRLQRPMHSMVMAVKHMSRMTFFCQFHTCKYKSNPFSVQQAGLTFVYETCRTSLVGHMLICHNLRMPFCCFLCLLNREIFKTTDY